MHVLIVAVNLLKLVSTYHLGPADWAKEEKEKMFVIIERYINLEAVQFYPNNFQKLWNVRWLFWWVLHR